MGFGAGFRSRFSVGFSERFSSAAGITLFMPGMRRRAIHVTRGPLFQGLFSTFGRFETWMTLPVAAFEFHFYEEMHLSDFWPQ
jgi:hypothetical protein